MKSLVELHGGSVEAHSEGLGRGSELVVRLPVGRAPSQPVDEPSRRAKDGTITPRRILVVDDNRDAADSLSMLLRFTGHTVETAYDGMAAIDIATSGSFDAILLDIGLPSINGYETARRIRAQARNQGVTLVALTGWGKDEDRQRSEVAGFDAHLVKPVDFAALTKVLAGADGH